ncbi:hypothetical protein BALU111458_17690 [Bacillus luti]
MFKKVTSVVASVLCASFLLTACSSGEKETKNTAKATDSESMNVMRNVFEGLYTLGEDNKLIPGVHNLMM